ncbi:hypothetical protein ABIB90_008490 [Bradyrhizobium sp. JR4.1]|uniref:hypothetical protein n=1 Tax=unclassified Bradyrhizobium TaxID=2631580 RepID=UPI003391A87F
MLHTFRRCLFSACTRNNPAVTDDFTMRRTVIGGQNAPDDSDVIWDELSIWRIFRGVGGIDGWSWAVILPNVPSAASTAAAPPASTRPKAASDRHEAVRIQRQLQSCGLAMTRNSYRRSEARRFPLQRPENAITVGSQNVSFGSFASVGRIMRDFRSTPVNGHSQDRRAWLKRAKSGHRVSVSA